MYVCMHLNLFEQRMAVGKPPSPFIANSFMSRFKAAWKKETEYFCRICLRYLDGILAIFDNTKTIIADFVRNLISTFDTTKFTAEKEMNNELPLLNYYFTM